MAAWSYGKWAGLMLKAQQLQAMRPVSMVPGHLARPNALSSPLRNGRARVSVTHVKRAIGARRWGPRGGSILLVGLIVVSAMIGSAIFGADRAGAQAIGNAVSGGTQWGQTTVTAAPAAGLPGRLQHRPARLQLAALPGRKGGTQTIARKIVITTKGAITIFALHLSRPVKPQVFTLAKPYRVVIDLPGVLFQIPKNSGGRGRGVIKTYRFGQFAPGRARIVLDASQAASVRHQMMTQGGQQGGAIFQLELEATDHIGFLLKPPQARIGPPSARPQMPLRGLHSAMVEPGAKPVIVIDPGHGGVDSGTVGVSSVFEKTVTMAVARRLRSILQRSKRYKVVLTRRTDVFVSLDDRVELSRKVGANLFISIHADAIGKKKLAAHVRGATVYTLSEQASDEQARALAAKENAVDALAGLQQRKSPQIKSILIDLLKRETANFSTNFSNLLLSRLRGRVRLHAQKPKTAAFHVLKQTHSPSVLIELGYMSNKSDEKQLRSVQWQRKMAGVIASAVDQFFAR